MTRILLAFLALIGLAATTAPAQARMAGRGNDTEIGISQGGGASCATCKVVRSLPAPTESAVARPVSSAKPRPAYKPIYIPTVQFGADRAFE